MLVGADEAREQEAPEAHPAHERAEQHAERDRRRTNHELEELKPDDFVYQGRTAAADEEQQQRRQEPSHAHQGVPFRSGKTAILSRDSLTAVRSPPTGWPARA